MSANPVITRGATIGQVSAEADDEFLFTCFVDNDAKTIVEDRNSPRMIILGSTGSGKTAILRMIEKNNPHVHPVQLDEVSLSYISNSDVINFLIQLEVPLDHFFQALWKHVLVSEYIKIRFNVDDEAKSKNFVGKLAGAFSFDSKKRRALDYIKKWQSKFWVEFDETVRDLTQTLENSVSTNFSGDLEKFRLDAGYVRKLSDEKKSHLQQRLRQYVDADLLSELSRVISLIGDYDPDSRKTYLVLLDRLDENWVSPLVRYHLIRSLIEAIKGLRRVADLKVVVAMRSDVFEKVIYDTRDRGFQAEKYEDYIHRLFWSSDQLKTIVNKRLNLLYRRKYTKDNVTFEEIFTERVDKQKAFQFILDRTLYRPRDVITFINMCFSQAEGKISVGRSEMRQAERLYSENRRVALIDEWRPVFPAIEPTLGMLKGRRAFFNLYELNTSDLLNTAVQLFLGDERYYADSMTKLLETLTSYTSEDATEQFVAALFERLYLIGAVGINSSPEQPVQWFYKTQRRLDKSSFGLSARVRVHPMLHSSLEIRQ